MHDYWYGFWLDTQDFRALFETAPPDVVESDEQVDASPVPEKPRPWRVQPDRVWLYLKSPTQNPNRGL